MCFSANASFTASALLAVAGIITLKKSHAPSRLLFAAIPLSSSLQQFSEGLLWLSLTDPAHAAWQMDAARSFLFVAEVLWPASVPLAILLLEKDPARKKILAILAALGILVAAYFAALLALSPVSAEISSHHIRYHQDLPLSPFFGIFYIIPTVVPLFLSTIKHIRLMALSILASYLITLILYNQYLISIWCFFAALLSLEVLWILTSNPATTSPSAPTQPVTVLRP